MTNKIQNGPQFNTSYNCNGCSHLINRDSLICSRLNEELNRSVVNLQIIPSVKCPYMLSGKLEYHKNEVSRIEKLEVVRVIINIFSVRDYQIDDSTGEICFKIKNEISLTQLDKVRKELPNYDLKINSHSSETMLISIIKN